MKFDEKQILTCMKNLDLTREEAIEMLMEDAETDGMSMKEINATMTAEQKQTVKAMTNSKEHKTKTAYNFNKRTRKTDDEKVTFIQKLFDFVKDFTENAEILKPEREITFILNGNSYSLTLTKHRPPKD